MVWGCFCGVGVGELRKVNATRNQAQYVELLRDAMVPSAERLFGRGAEYIFQQDNAPSHQALSVTT